MKKKLILLVSTLMCMLALCSCGNQSQDEDYANNSNLQAACEQSAQALREMSSDEIAYYQQYYESQEDGQIYADLMSQWAEIQPQVGEFVGLKDYSVTKAGKTVTAVQLMSFEKRDVKLTYVLNTNKNEVTGINVEMVYSLGETMGKAGMNTVMGISVVFAILILICLIIYGFNVIPVLQEKFKKNQSETKVEIAKTEVDSATESQPDDLELIAVITAAIAMQTGASTDDFVVRSIKRRY